MEERHSDQAVLAELGERLSATRLAYNLTQAQLARDAGVSKRTVERLEAGESAQLTSFLRVLRALGLLGRLDQLLPPAQPEPMELLRRDGKTPRRATRRSPTSAGAWTWSEES